jgi:hypothetical protein
MPARMSEDIGHLDDDQRVVVRQVFGRVNGFTISGDRSDGTARQY